MTRKKAKFVFITNDSARKSTFKKRKKGLMKKVSELSTLCGVEACAIIYNLHDSQPEVWPPNLEEAQRVVTKFKGLPEMEQSKKMVNHENFLRQRVIKSIEQLKKRRKENCEKEITQVMFQMLTGNYSLHNLTLLDFDDLGLMVEQYLKEIYKRMEILSNNSQPRVKLDWAESSMELNTVNDQHVHPQQVEINGSNLDLLNTDAVQRQPWFMELMNQQEHAGFGGFVGCDMMLPFGDNSSNAFSLRS